MVVVAIGLHIFFKNPVKDFKKFKRKGNTPIQGLTSTLLLTIANPITIFAFLALLASSGITSTMEQPYQTLFPVTGVFIDVCLYGSLDCRLCHSAVCGHYACSCLFLRDNDLKAEEKSRQRQ